MKTKNKIFVTDGKMENSQKVQDILAEDSKNPYLKMEEKEFLSVLQEAGDIELRNMCEVFAVSGSGMKESVKERIKDKYEKDKKVKSRGQYEKKMEFPEKNEKDVIKALKNL